MHTRHGIASAIAIRKLTAQDYLQAGQVLVRRGAIALVARLEVHSAVSIMNIMEARRSGRLGRGPSAVSQLSTTATKINY